MKLYIKNMVCVRCKKLVKYELEKLGINNISIELGEIELSEDLAQEKRSQLGGVLKELGMELIDDRKTLIIEKTKNAITELIDNEENIGTIVPSQYITNKVNYDYKYLSNIFSESQGITIEKYLINKKIERVKELIIHQDYTLSEISFHLNYSSVAHLSAQFKKVTGMTLSQYRDLVKPG